MERKDIEYRAVKSKTFEDSFISDYLVVLNDAFHSNQNSSFFERKYFNNVYGPSILVIAYCDSVPVGADALWRNDIDGHIAYQSADTCVREGYRGLGIFKGLVSKKLSLVEDGSLVYGFPNANSYHGFIKMGWTASTEYRPCLFTSINEYKKEHRNVIDNDYAHYWFAGKPGYGLIRKGDSLLLVSKRGGLPVYVIVGEVNPEMSSEFGFVPPACILLYKSVKRRWYNKSRVPTRIITYQNKFTVPVWKMDSI